MEDDLADEKPYQSFLNNGYSRVTSVPDELPDDPLDLD